MQEILVSFFTRNSHMTLPLHHGISAVTLGK